MAKIEVTETGPGAFEATVEAETTTRHRVHVDAEYAARIAPGVEAEELVRRSFEFLLEREPNTSILPQFDLSLIRRYFPEYEQWIGG